MTKIEIPWSVGIGNIVVEPAEEGDDLFLTSSDTPNEGLDRAQEIRVYTTKGTPQKEIPRTVSQAGKYEIMEPADGPVVDASGAPMWVPKQSV